MVRKRGREPKGFVYAITGKKPRLGKPRHRRPTHQYTYAANRTHPFRHEGPSVF